MMKLEDQVCSLELAKRLKALGVKQKNWLYWHVTKEDGIMLSNSPIFRTCFNKRIETEDRCVTSGNEVYSAYTVAELGGMLPTFYNSWHTAVNYACCDELGKHGGKTFTAKTEADARAKMLIWLIENGLIEEK